MLFRVCELNYDTQYKGEKRAFQLAFNPISWSSSGYSVRSYYAVSHDQTPGCCGEAGNTPHPCSSLSGASFTPLSQSLSSLSRVLMFSKKTLCLGVRTPWRMLVFHVPDFESPTRLPYVGAATTFLILPTLTVDLIHHTTGFFCEGSQ